jgi:hypothetical protein
MTADEIEGALLKLLDGFESPIAAYQIQDMKDLCRAGEAGIALENFATQLVEYDVHVPSGFVDQLETIGNAMGLDQKYWTWLREIVRG